MERITREKEVPGYIIAIKYKRTIYKTNAYSIYVKKDKDCTFQNIKKNFATILSLTERDQTR